MSEDRSQKTDDRRETTECAKVRRQEAEKAQRAYSMVHSVKD